MAGSDADDAASAASPVRRALSGGGASEWGSVRRRGVTLVARLPVSCGSPVVAVWHAPLESASLLVAVAADGRVRCFDVRRLGQPLRRGAARDGLKHAARAAAAAAGGGGGPGPGGAEAPRPDASQLGAGLGAPCPGQGPSAPEWSADASLAWEACLPTSRTGDVTCARALPWAPSAAMVFGTARGFVGVFDSRFRRLVALWRAPGGRAVTSLFPYLRRAAVPAYRLRPRGSAGQDRHDEERDEGRDADADRAAADRWGHGDRRRRASTSLEPGDVGTVSGAAGASAAPPPLRALASAASLGEDGDTPSQSRAASRAAAPPVRVLGLRLDVVMVKRLACAVALDPSGIDSAACEAGGAGGAWLPSNGVAFWCLETGACARALASVTRGHGPPASPPALERVLLTAQVPAGMQRASEAAAAPAGPPRASPVVSAVRCILAPLPLVHMAAKEEGYAITGADRADDVSRAMQEASGKGEDAASHRRQRRRPLVLAGSSGSGGGRERAYASAALAAMAGLRSAARTAAAAAAAGAEPRRGVDLPGPGDGEGLLLRGDERGRRPSSLLRGVFGGGGARGASDARARGSAAGDKSGRGRGAPPLQGGDAWSPGPAGSLVPASAAPSAQERRDRDEARREAARDRLLGAGALVGLGPLVAAARAAASALRGMGAGGASAAAPSGGSGQPAALAAEEACALVQHELDATSLPSWLLSAGDDRTVRCWDLACPRQSHVVTGPGGGRRFGAELPPSPAAAGGPAAPHGAAAAGAAPVLHLLCSEPGLVATQGPGLEHATSAADALARAAMAADIEAGADPAPRPAAGGGSEAPGTIQGAGGAGGWAGQAPSGTAHRAAVWDATWLDAPARLLVTASGDGTIRIWR